MTITAIGNQKGGVGKTTTACALADELAQRKRRVLVLDMDMQAHTSLTLGAEGEFQIDDVLVGDDRVKLIDAIVDTQWEGIKAVPGSANIVQFDQSTNAAMAAFRLRQAIADSNLTERFDDILIDTPPASTTSTTASLLAADQVLAVTEPEVLSIAGLVAFLKIIAEIRATIYPQLNLYGILVNKFDRRSIENQYRVKELIQSLEASDREAYLRPYDSSVVLDPYIPRRVAAQEMHSDLTPLHALRSNGAQVLSSLFGKHAEMLIEHGAA